MAMFYDGYWFQGSLASAIFYIVTAILTVVGNLLVLVTFIKDPYGQLRKRRNYFLASLALSDLLMGAFAEPLLAVGFWFDKDSVFFAHYVFAVLSGSSSLMNLTILSIIRYYAIRDPLGYEILISNRRALTGIAVVWLQSAHLALLPAFGWQTPPFQLYLYGVGFTIPCVFIFFAYFGIYRIIRHHTNSLILQGKRRAVHEVSSSVSSLTCCHTDPRAGARPQQGPTRKAVEREKRVTKTLVLIMVIFVLSWLPMLIIDVLMVQCASCRQYLHLARDITLTITYVSSGINPILYTLRMRQFRIAARKLLCSNNVVISLCKT